MAEIKIYLTLIGDDFDCNYVTRIVGLQPSTLRDKNEVLGNGREFGHYEWGIETDLIHTDDLSDIPDKFVLTIPCSSKQLFSLAAELKAQWHILFLVEVYDVFPALYFSAEFIKFAADIGAQFGFDTYLYQGIKND